jgi:hypothetical protein
MDPDFLDVRHSKGSRSSALRTGRLYPRRNPWYSFSEAESTPGHTVPSGGATEKIPSDTTGNRSRDLPTSSAGPLDIAGSTEKKVDCINIYRGQKPSVVKCSTYVLRKLTSFWGHNFDTRVGSYYAENSRSQWGCLHYSTDMAGDVPLLLSSRSVSTHAKIQLYTRLILPVLCVSVKIDLSPPREKHRWMVCDMRL